jgi:hypothetical protein
MAATANQLMNRADGCKVGYPVAASTHLYQGTLGFINATGYLDDDTASGVNTFAGMVIDEKDNSSGSAGDLNQDVWKDGEFLLTGSGFTQATVGQRIYATDNYTITATPSTANAVYIGVCTGYFSTTQIYVTLDPDGSGVAADRIVQVSYPIALHASKVIFNLLTAREALQVLSIDYTPDIAQGGALTATVVKATGTNTPASATTPMHTAAAINLNGTAHTVQSITLSATGADLILAAGDRIGFVESGAMTTGSGNVSIRMKRLS